MAITDERKLEDDSASKLGVALLGQVVRHLSEARDVIEFVGGEVDLNLGDVASVLNQAIYEVNQAFEAASLLMQGAKLDASWTNNASRPKAIFARHNAAVAAGAKRIEPALAPLVVRREPSPVTRDQLPPKPKGADRPKCGQPTKAGTPCAKIVVVLENGVLASGCDVHLPASERDSYERQRAQTDAWVQAATEHQKREAARMMADATMLWLRRQARELGMEWDQFCESVELTGEAPSTERYTPSNDDESDHGWSPCGDCVPYFIDTVAMASVGMHFLHGWAAQQRSPGWADPSQPAGDWLFEVPPQTLAQPHELGLSMAASVFAEIATPTDDIASAVDIRHCEIVDTMLGQFAHAGSLRTPNNRGDRPTVAPPPPGARPANARRPKKKRKKR